MSNHFEFISEGWWDSNGCDCYEPIYWEIFYCISHEVASSGCVEDLECELYKYVTGIDPWSLFPDDVATDELDEHVRSRLRELNVTYEIKES